MPFLVKLANYLRHLISLNGTLDGNFKANLFYKRDDGSNEALTDGMMYFPGQKEWEALAKMYVVREEDKEVPCQAHIGAIRHQGSVKYGNTAGPLNRRNFRLSAFLRWRGTLAGAGREGDVRGGNLSPACTS
ncbi:hypothetical protein DFH09DRAFT_1313542 [Mycena vulgaris]|nr:hypothetical protein DFH09DRAFT_1313542 [Mycena vulgaris]